MSDIIHVNQKVDQSLNAYGNGALVYPKYNRNAEACVIGWYEQMLREGRCYQLRAGTISVPLVGDVVLTDAKAEMALDAGSGVTCFVTAVNISVNLGAGTLHEYAVKSVATASTGGDVFVPLPLYLDGTTAKPACRATARVDAAGGVTVTAELATTTRRHWSGGSPVAIAAGDPCNFDFEPRTPILIQNDACCYVQIAATGTGPSYFASLDFIEMAPENVE